MHDSDPRSVNEWMDQLGIAALAKDEDALDRLERVSEGWLQTSEDQRVQVSLVHAIRELIES